MRRYGVNRLNPTGTPEDPERCIVEVPVGVVPEQCQHPRGYGPNGAYCAQHAKWVNEGDLVVPPDLDR